MDNELYNNYREYFLSFLARTNQKQRTNEHLLDYLSLYSPQTIDIINQRKKVRFLDIGTGTGKLFIPLVASLGDRIDCVVKEPNLGMAITFFFNYMVEDLPYQRLTLDHNESLNIQENKFDFVLASHSFYYLHDWDDALKAIYNSLVPGGAACIVMSSRENDLFKLREEFFPILHNISPKSAENLTNVLGEIEIPYETHIIDSRVDLTPDINDDITHLREDGILKPSLDSLISFLLRTDYTKLSMEEKERVEEFIYEKSNKGRYLRLKDKAIWFTKPGVYNTREDAGENIPLKITLADFTRSFRLDKHFGNDVSFLSPALREKYFSILALDCILTHPISRLMMMNKDNAEIRQDDESLPVPIEGKSINDFILFDPSFKIKLKETPMYGDDMYILLYTQSSYALFYLLDHMEQEYGFLPKEEQKYITREEFSRLILNLFDKFKHNRVFSNRYDGSTLMGNFLASEYFEKDKLKTPESPTPRLTEIYNHLNSLCHIP